MAGSARISVSKSGPVFDGRAALAVDAYGEDVTDTIAKQGVNDVRNALHGVLRNPTGNYSRHIVTERQSNDNAVTDSGIIYGPWLEGVGSRNSTTRFKGYFTFRRVTQQLDGKAGHMAEMVLNKYVRRMN